VVDRRLPSIVPDIASDLRPSRLRPRTRPTDGVHRPRSSIVGTGAAASFDRQMRGAPRVAHGYSGGDCERARRTSLRETCSILGLVTSLGRDASESPDRAIRAIPIAKGYAEHGFGG